MIGILCASTNEVNAIVAQMTDIRKVEGSKLLYHGKLLDNKQYTGKLGEKEVVVSHIGNGKVYAAVATDRLIQEYQLESVISVGKALSINPEYNVGDIVFARRVADWDIERSNWEQSMISDGVSYTCDGRTNFFVEGLSKNDNSIKLGEIISGEKIVTNEELEYIKQFFITADCCDTECGSIACACYMSNIMPIMVRVITQKFGVSKEEAKKVFDIFDTDTKLAEIIKEIISELPIN